MWKTLGGGSLFGDFSMCSVVGIGLPVRALPWVPSKTQAGGNLRWAAGPYHPLLLGAQEGKALLSHLCAPTLVSVFTASKVISAWILSCPKTNAEKKIAVVSHAEQAPWPTLPLPLLLMSQH